MSEEKFLTVVRTAPRVVAFEKVNAGEELVKLPNGETEKFRLTKGKLQADIREDAALLLVSVPGFRVEGYEEARHDVSGLIDDHELEIKRQADAKLKGGIVPDAREDQEALLAKLIERLGPVPALAPAREPLGWQQLASARVPVAAVRSLLAEAGAPVGDKEHPNRVYANAAKLAKANAEVDASLRDLIDEAELEASILASPVDGTEA